MQDPTQFREQQHLNCPRCKSSNTKFCYYNNYNLTQPRHFCKTCKRYWTKGGTLRNIPVGGVSRKTNTKRSSNPKRSLSPPSPASVIGTQYQSKPEQVESGLVQGSRSLDLNEDFSSLLTPSEQFTKLLVELNTIRSSTAALAENPISSSESNMIRTEFGSSENTEKVSVEDSSCYLSFSTPGSVDKVVNYL